MKLHFSSMWHELKYLLIISTAFLLVYCIIDVSWFTSIHVNNGFSEGQIYRPPYFDGTNYTCCKATMNNLFMIQS